MIIDELDWVKRRCLYEKEELFGTVWDLGFSRFRDSDGILDIQILELFSRTLMFSFQSFVPVEIWKNWDCCQQAPWWVSPREWFLVEIWNFFLAFTERVKWQEFNRFQQNSSSFALIFSTQEWDFLYFGSFSKKHFFFEKSVQFSYAMRSATFGCAFKKILR